MNDTDTSDARLMALLGVIVRGDHASASNMLSGSPDLIHVRIRVGASRQAEIAFFQDEIKHYLYAGDTALHAAAAAYRYTIVRELLANGADVRSKNHRGAEPLHYAVDGIPGSLYWDPIAQAATVTCLLESGADPNAIDKSGVAPLHRAVRTRCATAVKALLDGGADALVKNKKGSTPLVLATHNTGRGGTGTLEAKEQQAEILRLLRDGDSERN